MLTRDQERQVEIWLLMRPFATPDFEELAFQRWHWAYPRKLRDNRQRYAERYRHNETFRAANRARAKAWYVANAERAREVARKRMAARRAQDPERVRALNRASYAARKGQMAAE
jgi:hypothetical protein